MTDRRTTDRRTVERQTADPQATARDATERATNRRATDPPTTDRQTTDPHTTAEPDLDALRREARRLHRAVTRGDARANDRARAILGDRLDARFVLADALHVVAREHGARSWPALVDRHRRGPIRTELDEDADEDGVAEVDVETGFRFPGGDPVTITVRRRGRRLMLDDGGEAVRRAGRPRGWAEAAERAVEPSGMNVARSTGKVFVPAWDSGRADLERLATRLARASLDVYEALVELE